MKRKTNQILSVLLSAIMLVSVFTIALPEITSVQAETTAESFTYSLEGNNAVITEYIGTDTEVTVPQTIDGYTVTGIDEFAFFMNYGITSVTLPQTVEYIGDYAFFHCALLRNVNFEGNTVSLGTSAFEGCYALSEITLPDTAAEIGERAFLNCTSLKTVTTGTTVDKVGAYAFGYARNTSNWNYEKISMTVKGYDGTAADAYCTENGISFQSMGTGTAADTSVSATPEEDLEIPALYVTDFNNYTDTDDTTLNIRDVINRSSKDYTANATAVYSDPETGLSFEVYANLKLQGNSSMSYPKKNFTIKLYSDEIFDSKYKVELQDGWGKENKYVLKANYMDHSQSRNVFGAKLWGQIVNSRETTYQQLLDSPNGGAIDGFPVKVYINGRYEGLYTFNIPKDDWQFAMGDGTNEALLAGESHSGSCNFTEPGRYDESDWTIEYPDPEEEDTTWVETSFNEVINFVSNSSDEEFKSLFNDYLDYDSCIDYYVYMLFICGTDNWEKNMLMATYDGKQWFPSVYDMDSTFGIYWNGGHYNTVDWMLTHEYVGADHGTNSLLWERVYQNFYDDIVSRYAELRDTVLDEKNFVKTLNDFIGDIPKEVFDRDLDIYGGIPSSGSSDPNQIINYTLERLRYLDGQFGYENAQPDNPIKDNLKAKIDEANAIDTSKYTEVSAAYLIQEISYAENIYNTLASTETQLINAADSIDRAIKLLIPYENAASLDLALIPQSQLSADAPNYHVNEDGSKAIDGNKDTMWHTLWSSDSGELPVISENGVNNYITITINSEDAANVAAISYLPRVDSSYNGVISQYRIKYSTQAEGEDFIDVPGGYGVWLRNKDEKFCIFEIPVEAKRIRLYGESSFGDSNNKYISAAEINLYTTDTSALLKAAEDAGKLSENDYTSDSFAAMQTQLDASLAILAQPTSYQTEINAAYASLVNAVEALVPGTVDKAALKALIDETSAIDTSVYTKVSAQALADAIDAASAVYGNSGASQTDIDNAADALKLAIAGLKYYMGDIDHNGVVTVTDATILQIYLARASSEEIDKDIADLNGDGYIDITDATIIQQICAKIIIQNDDGSIAL